MNSTLSNLLQHTLFQLSLHGLDKSTSWISFFWIECKCIPCGDSTLPDTGKKKISFLNLMSHWHDSFSQGFNILFLKIKFWKTFESAAWFYKTGNWIEKISMKQFKNISKNLAKNLVVTHFHPKYCWSHLWPLFDRNVLISASAVSGSQGGVQASAGKCCYFAGNLLSPWLSLVVLKYFSLSL